jgi:hypothetical protein
MGNGGKATGDSVARLYPVCSKLLVSFTTQTRNQHHVGERQPAVCQHGFDAEAQAFQRRDPIRRRAAMQPYLIPPSLGYFAPACRLKAVSSARS